LKGENVKRWRIESDDLFLINTPKGQVDIEAYPAVRDWLVPFKQALEKRATKQEWWELQQAQVAYQDRLAGPKIVWPHFQHERSFVIDRTGTFLNNKCFFLAGDDAAALALLNSSALWFQLVTAARAKRGGYIEAEAQYVGELAVPDCKPADHAALAKLVALAGEAAGGRFALDCSVQRRILSDLGGGGKLTRKLEAWHNLDFAAFRAEVKKTFGTEIPLKERGDWETWLAENAAEVHRLTAEISAAEREIDAIVYRLFDLTPEEIALLEASIAGQH
jgi:hypothetical protein